MKYVLLAGRIFFSLLFLIAGFGHFSQASIGMGAHYGLPLASVLVPLSGVVCLAGALSIMLGYKARWGAWMIVLFMIPTTFIFHAFWAETDPMMKQMQMVMFFKNISIMGTAMCFAYFGTGPLSIDHQSKVLAAAE